MAKVLLINPPFYRILGSTNNLVRLQQAALSAVLTEHGHEVYQYNADADHPENTHDWTTLYATPIEKYKAVVMSHDHEIWKEAKEVIKKISPDCIGVTVFSGCIEQAARLSEIGREFGIKMFAGGSHPTTVGNLKLGGLDHESRRTVLTSTDLHLKGVWDGVCIGDGEEAILKFISGGWEGVCLGGNIKHLDSYPYPQKDNYVGPSWFKQTMLEKGSLLTSRGCRYRCTFCAQNLVAGESMRWHSPEYVMGQIKELCYSYGGENGYDGKVRLTFYDDVFTLAERRVQRICELITDSDLHLDFRIETRADCLCDDTIAALTQAGCTRVKLGIESGVQEIVDKMNKKLDLKQVVKAVERLKAAGIGITGNFIVGYPGETDEQAHQSITFARSLQLDSYSVSVYTAYAGTPDYSSYGGVGLDDPSELFHTNKNLLVL